jgi:hypothetical protein
MSSTSIADHATLVSGVTTSGADARVQSGQTDLPKVPISGGSSLVKTGGKKTRSRKSQSKRRKSRSGRRKYRKTAKK